MTEKQQPNNEHSTNHTINVDSQYKTIQAVLRKNRKVSPFWLLPFIALCIGAILFFQIIEEQGKTIKITFTNGSGLVADKTPIRYQGLQIGVVKKVNFTDNMQKVEVIANIYPEATGVLRENTKFWVVQPSVSLAGISGLDSLVSGNYITLQPGDGDTEDQFIAQEKGPIAQVSPGDLLIHLVADDLGSISIGSSIYFKKLPVGKIYDYRFNENNKVEIDVVIGKEYTHFVKKDSRFWNISGVTANISPSGLNFSMESLNAVVQGAVSFDSPVNSANATENTIYTLYSSLQEAKRGIEVSITLPNVAGLEAGRTDVYFQEHKVGVLSALTVDENNEGMLKGTLLVDPNQINLLKTHTHIIFRNKKPSLADLADPQRFFRGDYFEIIPGDGTEKLQFDVVKENELLLKAPNTLVIKLTAPESYGVSEGQSVYYNNIAIGEIVKQQINVEGVEYQVAIGSAYRNLINPNTLFVAASNFDVNLGIDGVRFESAHPEKWLQGGIRIIAKKGLGNALKTYPLYKNTQNAESGITGNLVEPDITLKTSTLPSISKGSLILYHQYEVGKITNIQPQTNHFNVDVYIYPPYKHLLTDKSIFWVESAAQVDITPKGISIQATPIARSLKGAISFDNSGSGKNNTLYPNELRAKSAGQVITLTADDATNLSKGMSLRYLGLSIGEVESITLDPKSHKITAKALINPNYMGMIAKEGATFKIISPQISAGAIENLDSLLQPYIDVEVGKGKAKTQFNLAQTSPSRNKYSNGVPFILETNDAMNLTEGSPVLYRGVEVGSIRKFDLNDLGDRVLIHIAITPKYQHLVRKNSEFWVSSGYDFSLGWKGAEFNTGSVQQLLKGGISFSTPSGTVVQPQASVNQRFLLQIKRPVKAPDWSSGALPNQ
ncbi:PqiB family protein [Rodentibacter caecimuris]|uniref:PqiB family protein n=1 Tax=Rodentibacter caecimuris TaxID=1796644 RepID=UPI00109458A7|nr:PqiB family protein [Pasteurella caecimuris]MCR1836722.1 MlaD family protein [Pasteurella caecimuris]MCU0106063.1 MlaD family protein [Pasteurella caecimuris]TGY51136.1 PqiB family protein [Pasteurella caecimuris]